MHIIPFARKRLYNKYIVKSIHDYVQKKHEQDTIPTEANSDAVTRHPRVTQVMKFFMRRFEHNAGFVDLICLILLLELFLPIFISWLLFLIFLLWQVVYFVAGFYVVAKGGWVENELRNKLEQFHKEDSAAL